MKVTTIEDILGDFMPTSSEKTANVKDGSPVTFWLPTHTKASYDRLQEKSGRRFGKKMREALIQLIDVAESRAS